ncbi:long-chain-fatty-acid--CoA ligase [Chelativorans sp. AA-79]|uniref:long-chain-fatty-acid--CoA ligase n=1 Tax=Chelativorans sp. AA-79 TaxID=3028735 RepID=UPI0023F89E1A|nr:long-chain-fatty-acid--CoA ligase [Chelativorans sp. AA-79]WEX12042.1 long-chain-fatty-acid--CoA ligase [Chelativorans sp. AA-79]
MADATAENTRKSSAKPAGKAEAKSRSRTAKDASGSAKAKTTAGNPAVKATTAEAGQGAKTARKKPSSTTATRGAAAKAQTSGTAGSRSRAAKDGSKEAAAAASTKPASKRATRSSSKTATARSPAENPAEAKMAASAKAAGARASTGKKAARGTTKSSVESIAAAEARSPAGQKSTRKTRAASTSAKTTSRKTAAKSPAGAMEKPWLTSYPEGIPTEIGAFQHSSLPDMLLEACRTFGDRPAFTCMGKTISFTELEKASRDFAAYLQSKGLQKGARVAVMMPNLLQYPVVMMAVLRAGYVVVNVNPLYTPRELEHQLRDSGAEAIVILENFAKTVQASIGKTDVKHVVVATMGDMLGLKGHVVNLVVRRVKKLVPAWELPGHVPFRQALREGAGARFSPPEVALDDLAFLQYTGGTTGVAKGAMLLHRNVLANVIQSEIWLQTAYLSGRKQPERPVFICVLPLYHIYAMTVNAMTGVKLGAQNILITNPRDLPALVKELGKYEFNVFVGLNTLFNALLNNADFQKLDFKHLDFTLGGGMAVQRSVAERWKKLTGQTISEGYGLSETSPVATINRLDRNEFTGTIGLPLPSTDVTIRDDHGRDVKLGEVGEICIRGPQVMAGYWNQPEETAKAIMPDGFLKTGDMGIMDETGHIRIVDRKKDMILVSGFNVYPNEIEDVLAHHPGVLEVAAVGVPDEHSGEAPKVFVVKKDPALTEKQILDYCRENLTGYKRPKHVEFRSELPKTNVGKILRRELR